MHPLLCPALWQRVRCGICMVCMRVVSFLCWICMLVWAKGQARASQPCRQVSTAPGCASVCSALCLFSSLHSVCSAPCWQDVTCRGAQIHVRSTAPDCASVCSVCQCVPDCAVHHAYSHLCMVCPHAYTSGNHRHTRLNACMCLSSLQEITLTSA